MNILLIFFALPIAIIIISIALQRILKCPALVAAIVFSIFLVVTFVINNLNFLVAAIIYAILSFLVAVATNIICRCSFRIPNPCRCQSQCGEQNQCGCQCQNQNLNVEQYRITGSNGVNARVNVIPNRCNNERNMIR